MSHDNAVDGTIGRNRNAIHNAINWISKKFEAGDERDVEFGAGKLNAESRRVIQHDIAGPTVN
jgi:hypothetical protein